MYYASKWLILGLHLTTLLHSGHSFVLLTANVEDLKRIAQKFVSDSVAEKIAQFIIEAADNKVEIDNSNATKNLSEYNDEFDVEKKDTKADYGGEFRQKPETKTKQEFKPIKVSSAAKTKPKAEEVHKDNKANKKKKQIKSKSKKPYKKTTDVSSLEFYRSEIHSNNLNANSIIDLEKIHESDDSSNAKISRKEFDKFDYFDKSDETQTTTDKLESEIQRYIENDASANKTKKDASENTSEDISNRLDEKSEEISTVKANLSTAVERNEFDQYFNTNYPKSKVVATSGPVELTKSNKTESSDTDYE